MKLPGVISLRKLLPIWAMPNGGFLRAAGHHVGEVEEDALRGLGAQVVQAGLVLDDAEVGLEQAGELARLGPRAAGAAVGAGDVGEVDRRRGRRCPSSPRTPPAGGRRGSACGSDWHSVSGSVNVATWPEASQVWRGRITRRVEADDVVARLHHRAPPLALDVLLELDAERAVVPRRAGAAVDLAARVDEAPALGEGDDVVDGGGGRLGHGGAPCRSACPSAGCGGRSAHPTEGRRPAQPSSRGIGSLQLAVEGLVRRRLVDRPAQQRHGTDLHVVRRERPAVAADVRPAGHHHPQRRVVDVAAEPARRRTPAAAASTASAASSVAPGTPSALVLGHPEPVHDQHAPTLVQRRDRLEQLDNDSHFN